MKEGRDILSRVREQYERAAAQESCCKPTCCCDTGESLGEGLVGPRLSCGNPLARVELLPGQHVLDIGCGAGREVIEAAKRVGPAGIAYGLDMTDAMLKLSLENRRRAGVHNAVFFRATMENIPLPSESVDVIISNCVINLSPDKPAVMSEMFRVLRPGGRLAISDTVVEGEVPLYAREDPELWCQCLSGAMRVEEYRQNLERAGFVGVEITVEGWYDRPSLEEDGWRVGSAFISASRPSSVVESLEQSWTVRPAQPTDLGAALEILEHCELPTAGVAEHFNNFIVACDDGGALIGLGGLEIHSHQALLRSVCVTPGYRGRGLGSKLTRLLVEKARNSGCTQVYLLTTTAAGYFEKQGFTRVARADVKGPVLESEEFKHACPASATVMMMPLSKTCCC